MTDPTPEECRVLSGELHDAMTRLRLARKYASSRSHEHLARTIETWMVLMQNEVDHLCHGAGITPPLWAREETTPTLRPGDEG